jgi:hypothetical protein
MMSQPCWRKQVRNSVPQCLAPGVSLNLKRFVCISSRIVGQPEITLSLTVRIAVDQRVISVWTVTRPKQNDVV